MNTNLWIEYDASDGSGAARWESVNDKDIDTIMSFAERVIGRIPDTIA